MRNKRLKALKEIRLGNNVSLAIYVRSTDVVTMLLQQEQK
jgi:hypothetical protein